MDYIDILKLVKGHIKFALALIIFYTELNVKLLKN